MRKRNYGIDLLRIVSMYMIVILHILGQGGVLGNLEVFSIKYYLAWILEITCYCSVNCYALITGYVMLNNKFDYKKIMHLIIDVLFGGIIINIIYSIFTSSAIPKIDYLKSIFNITFNTYWYFSSYFALFLFIPFANKLIDILDDKMYKRLIYTIIILMCFINGMNDPFKVISGYSFIWLLSLYFIGAYIRKFEINNKFKNHVLLLSSIILSFILITFASKIIFMKIGINHYDLLIKYNSFTILLISILMFILFCNMKFKNKYIKKIIAILSSSTFGVYIIHCHPVIWKNIIRNSFVFLTDYTLFEMICFIILCGIVIYLLCSYIEIFRKYLFKKFKIYFLFDWLYTQFVNVIKTT